MIKVEINNGKAELATPYNPDFVDAVKKIGGAKWDGEKKCWTVPEAQLPAARIVMENVYGYSDQTPNETISLKLTFECDVSEIRSDVVMFGKVLAHAYGRDSGARPGDDVAYIRGGAASGGSVKNWHSTVEEGSIVILNNVNRSVFDRTGPIPDVTVEVIEDYTDKDKLIEEKERLLKRIDEIDAILQEMQ